MMDVSVNINLEAQRDVARHIALATIANDESRYVRGVYIPSQMERLTRTADSLSQSGNTQIVLISQDPSNLQYDVHKGADVLGVHSISAAQIVSMSENNGPRIMLHGTQGAAKELRTLQRMIGEYKDVSPTLLMKAIQDDNDLDQSPREEVLSRIKVHETVHEDIAIDSHSPPKIRP